MRMAAVVDDDDDIGDGVVVLEGLVVLESDCLRFGKLLDRVTQTRLARYHYYYQKLHFGKMQNLVNHCSFVVGAPVVAVPTIAFVGYPRLVVVAQH